MITNTAVVSTPSEKGLGGIDYGCQDGKEDRGSNICAAWKAADAASRSADSDLEQVLIGWIGVGLGGVTMLSAMAAAYYARRAAVATEGTVSIAHETSKISQKAIEIAQQNSDATIKTAHIAEQSLVNTREIAELQNRAYVAVSYPRWVDNPEKIKRILIEIKYQNYGSSIALNLRGENQILVLPGMNKNSLHELAPVDSMPGASKGALPKGIEAGFRTECLWQEGLLEGVRLGKVIIVVRGWLLYDDVFGSERRTEYCFHMDADTIRELRDFAKSPSGNSMS